MSTADINREFQYNKKTNKCEEVKPISTDVTKTKVFKAHKNILDDRIVHTLVKNCFICGKLSASSIKDMMDTPDLVSCMNCNRLFYERCDVTNYKIYEKRESQIQKTHSTLEDYSDVQKELRTTEFFILGTISGMCVIIVFLILFSVAT